MSSLSTPLRIGLVGCGSMGTIVADGFADDDRASIVAVTEIDDAAREAAGERYGVDASDRYRDYEAMFEGTALDAVSIATPHALHYEQVTAAMDRGLDVLCEKPLTTELDHARELTDRAESGDPVLMVGYQRHLDPSFRRARRRFAESRPTFVTAEITQNWIDSQSGKWRTDPELSGGGFLYDTGSHILDAVCWTTRLTPAWVSAEMTFADDDRRVDSRALLTVGFEGGTTATVSVFGDAPTVREHIHIWDDDGAVYLDGRGWSTRSFAEVDDANATTEPYVRGDGPTKAEAFIDAVVDGEQPPATARDALLVTAITEAAYESARTGDRVDLPDMS